MRRASWRKHWGGQCTCGGASAVSSACLTACPNPLRCAAVATFGVAQSSATMVALCFLAAMTLMTTGSELARFASLVLSAGAVCMPSRQRRNRVAPEPAGGKAAG